MLFRLIHRNFILGLYQKGSGSLARKKKVVDENELVEILSAIARGDVGNDEAVKVSERLKAAELLGKRYSIFGAGDVSDGEIRVVVDYVGQADKV